MLDDLAAALKPDWHAARAAGRLKRHTEILRDVARVISADPEREDRPATAAEAEERFAEYLSDLKTQTPRSGLAAPTAAFVDRLDTLRKRYGHHLFVCFDDELVPASTNGLEGFFSTLKRHARQVLGTKSTANSLVQNLDEDYVLAFAARDEISSALAQADLDAKTYELSRAQLRAREQPARRRRSAVRSFDQRLQALRAATLASASP